MTDTRGAVGSNSTSFNITGTTSAATYVLLSTDRPSYDLALGQTMAEFTAIITDETGSLISGLNSGAFATSLDSLPTTLSFNETNTPGTYTALMGLTSIGLGSHVANLVVTNTRGVSNADSVIFQVTSATPPNTFLHLSMTTERLIYDLDQGQSTATITALVTNEGGLAVSSLSNVTFTTEIDGQARTVVFQPNTGTGIYTGTLDLSSLSNGSHQLSVTVTDTRGLSASVSRSLNIIANNVTPPGSLIHVSDIAYSWQGRDLYLTLEVKDESNNPVPGASLTVALFYYGQFFASAPNTTGQDGKTSFVVRNASYGCYFTLVTELSKTGSQRDTFSDVNDSGSCF